MVRGVPDVARRRGLFFLLILLFVVLLLVKLVLLVVVILAEAVVVADTAVIVVVVIAVVVDGAGVLRQGRDGLTTLARRGLKNIKSSVGNEAEKKKSSALYLQRVDCDVEC